MSEKICPNCNGELDVLLFLGISPDGYVCPKCQVYFNDDLKPLAMVIGL